MAYYCIVKYVPNPITDECINVGVLTFEGDGVACRFLEDFSRARALGIRDPSFLRSVVSEFRQSVDQKKLSERDIRHMCETWHGQVQLTSPRGSTETARTLIDSIARMFLQELAPSTGTRSVGKRRTLKLAVDSLAARISERYGTSKWTARRAIKRDYETTGHFERHHLDLAVANGHLQLGALALSFAHGKRAVLKRNLDATAFIIEDVRRSNRRVPLFVFGHEVKAGSPEFEHATTLFQNWNTKVVVADKIQEWSDSVSKKLSLDLVGK